MEPLSDVFQNHCVLKGSVTFYNVISKNGHDSPLAPKHKILFGELDRLKLVPLFSLQRLGKCFILIMMGAPQVILLNPPALASRELTWA